MDFTFFIGIDVSKDELDFAVQRGRELLFHREVTNQPNQIKAFLKELDKILGFKLSSTVFCMEHTGVYCNHLLNVLHKKNASISLEAATHIRNSQGNIRGKNDKIDSIRIASYAYKNREELRLWKPKRAVIQQISHFSAMRLRLIEAKKMLTVPLIENGPFLNKKEAKDNNRLCSATLRAIQADIEKTEKALNSIIDKDPELKKLFDIITSVEGIGLVTAVQVIISTNEFKDINNPKKFASYSGVAPFTDDSGRVVKKARVSHMANKKMKTLLHMAALIAIRYNSDLKKFYKRKVEIEKKNKMLVINAIRNKLILRIFACVNQNKKYEKNYQRLVA
ncbi:IS110 family transposase [Pedobacter sp. R-06]|uniref:IS110 family transposase n=1 Tax=Pedobacter sp. R-06 TaxID=3404051 RepID=UPI003CE78435